MHSELVRCRVRAMGVLLDEKRATSAWLVQPGLSQNSAVSVFIHAPLSLSQAVAKVKGR